MQPEIWIDPIVTVSSIGFVLFFSMGTLAPPIIQLFLLRSRFPPEWVLTNFWVRLLDEVMEEASILLIISLSYLLSGILCFSSYWINTLFLSFLLCFATTIAAFMCFVYILWKTKFVSVSEAKDFLDAYEWLRGGRR